MALRDRIAAHAKFVVTAQQANSLVSPAGTSEGAMPMGGTGTPSAEAPPAVGAGTDNAPDAPMDEMASEDEGLEAPEKKDSNLDNPTPWIVKFHEGNFWVGRVFPEEYIDQAVRFFSERKSIPKEQVREYFEKLKEGKKEEMPEEMQNAPDIDEGAVAPAEGGAPTPPAGGEMAMMGEMPM